jgi:hypothetical protein
MSTVFDVLHEHGFIVCEVREDEWSDAAMISDTFVAQKMG